MQKMTKVLGFGVVSIAVAVVINSCAATAAEIHHSNLNVESKMSNSIFLNPLDTGEKTIYVQVRNTSTQSLSNLTAAVKDNLRNSGYTIMNKPQKAHELLQINILQYGAAKNPDEVWKNTDSGYGSVVTGALAGIGIATLSGNNSLGIEAGLGVAAASWIADELIKDKAYSLITDVQISVHMPNNTWKKYNTRVASVADKVNLKFEEAKPLLVEQLAKEISSIFASND